MMSQLSESAEEKEQLRQKKRSLRKSVLEKREAMNAENRRRADLYIADRIIGHQWFYRADVLLAFVNYGSEISTEEIILEALRKGKKVFVPKIIKKIVEADNSQEGAVTCNKSAAEAVGTVTEVMEFYQIASLDELVSGYKGIKEPAGTTECFDYQTYEETNLLLLMPGVAFDIFRNRMGYGKGFYDRYIADKPKLETYSIGIGYKCQQVDLVPTDEFDKKPYQVILA